NKIINETLFRIAKLYLTFDCLQKLLTLDLNGFEYKVLSVEENVDGSLFIARIAILLQVCNALIFIY
ncbi:hypothetical protein, partial [Psychrobacter aquimaris]|uniref:hypothetical protein n=1 Tax=Psychrobacter aquimaris TaxID=292733 RepID=UPI003FD40D42